MIITISLGSGSESKVTCTAGGGLLCLPRSCRASRRSNPCAPGAGTSAFACSLLSRRSHSRCYCCCYYYYYCALAVAASGSVLLERNYYQHHLHYYYRHLPPTRSCRRSRMRRRRRPLPNFAETAEPADCHQSGCDDPVEATGTAAAVADCDCCCGCESSSCHSPPRLLLLFWL